MGTVAGFLKKNGYWVVGLKGEYWLVHLIIWVMHYGNEIPDDKMIDHINRNKADNRIENLRLVSMSHNTINSLKVDLAEGVYHAGKLYPFRPYRASIKINGKRVDLGWFASREGGCDGLQRSCSK